MPNRDCQALKLFLSVLYKTAAAAGLATIVVTLDVTLSITVIIAAFGLYYLSRAIVSRLCPAHDQQEHWEVVRSIRPSGTGADDQRAAEPLYSGNVTPLRRKPTVTTSRPAPVAIKVRNR